MWETNTSVRQPAQAFSDIDVLLAGRAVADAEKIFDAYWNSDATLPVTSLHRIRRGKLAKLRYRLAQHSGSYHASSYIRHSDQRFKNSMVHDLKTLEWVDKAEVIADPPEKAKAIKVEQWIGSRIFEVMNQARRELLLVLALFYSWSGWLVLIAETERAKYFNECCDEFACSYGCYVGS